MVAGTSGSPHHKALRHVAARASGTPLAPGLKLTMNFHPDRMAGDRLLLLQMAEDGVYYSQFVTGTSNGGLTAHRGGDRWRWESRIFGGAYDHAAARERPVYGALNHHDSPVGGAPRFGSSHFRLTGDALERTTFCYPDSSTDPAAFAVASRFALIGLAEADGLDALDGHIEAHVHGPVRFDRDVEALVLDPSYRGTDVEEAARRLPCPVEWHPGFRLTVDHLRHHPDYRGQEYVDLGTALATEGCLTPLAIGRAARTGRHDPQALKKVWHCLARFGAPPRLPAALHAPATPPCCPYAQTMAAGRRGV
ncbi:DUF3626 domain-containing protein [Streptomyces sp. NPDC089919]|uniref:DUF3626 domain-containing protein n=1 Tax=Streptomyces sp. NPDC089919 TaxID=3155188 RepID=UPI003425F8E6